MSDKESSDDNFSKSNVVAETPISNELQKIHRLNNEEKYATNLPSSIDQQLTISTTISGESCDFNTQKLEQNHSNNECCIRIMSSSYDSDDDNDKTISTVKDEEYNDTLYSTDRITHEITSPTSSKQSKDDKPIFLSELHNSTIFLISNLSVYSILGVLIRYFISELFYSGCENGKLACVTSMQSPMFVDLPANSK